MATSNVYGAPAIDLDAAREFLHVLDPSGRPYTFQTFDDAKARRTDSLARVFHGDFDPIAPKLIDLNKEGAGIFVMINIGDGVKKQGAKSCRTVQNVIGIRAFFADLDGAPLDPVFMHGPTPTLVVESSLDRWHVYWAQSNAPLYAFQYAQKYIAIKYEGDQTVHDLPRVMRLPGFIHQKTEPFQSRVVYMGLK